MEELSNASLYLGLGGALIVAGLIEAVKRMLGLADTLWTRVLPAVALVLGFVWNVLVWTVWEDIPINWPSVIFLGVFTGLSAIGLYTGQRDTRGA